MQKKKLEHVNSNIVILFHAKNINYFVYLIYKILKQSSLYNLRYCASLPRHLLIAIGRNSLEKIDTDRFFLSDLRATYVHTSPLIYYTCIYYTYGYA